MNIILPALAVAFAALCVWLGVRIFNRRERWAKWTAVAVIMLGYPLSIGPIECLAWHDLLPRWGYHPIEVVYRPLLFLIEKCGARGAFDWYLTLWRH